MDSYSSAFWATYGFVLFIVGIIGVVLSVVVAKAAERKGRSFAAFLLLGLFVSPIISGIVVAVLPEPSTLDSARSEGKTRPCPRCGEEIMAIASICKHCQSEIEPILKPTKEEVSVADSENQELAEFWLDWHKKSEWVKAGSPNLKPWIDAGQPDFYKWLQSL